MSRSLSTRRARTLTVSSIARLLEWLAGVTASPELVAGRDWALDAVYTRIETSFLQNARAAGLSVMSGYELFIGQGVDAFRLFTGRDVDYTMIRNALQG